MFSPTLEINGVTTARKLWEFRPNRGNSCPISQKVCWENSGIPLARLYTWQVQSCHGGKVMSQNGWWKRVNICQHDQSIVRFFYGFVSTQMLTLVDCQGVTPKLWYLLLKFHREPPKRRARTTQLRRMRFRRSQLPCTENEATNADVPTVNWWSMMVWPSSNLAFFVQFFFHRVIVGWHLSSHLPPFLPKRGLRPSNGCQQEAVKALPERMTTCGIQLAMESFFAEFMMELTSWNWCAQQNTMFSGWPVLGVWNFWFLICLARIVWLFVDGFRRLNHVEHFQTLLDTSPFCWLTELTLLWFGS